MMGSNETNENNNVSPNILKRCKIEEYTSEKDNWLKIMANRLSGSIKLEPLPATEMDSTTTSSRVENNDQILMLQPLLNFYVQNKYIDELFRKTQNTYLEHLSKLIGNNESQPPQEYPLDLSLKPKREKVRENDILEYGSMLLHKEKLNYRFHCKSPRKLIDSYNNILQISTNNNSNVEVGDFDPEMTTVIQNIVKEEETTFSCSMCNQVFGVQDRLAKHIASCHKSKKKQAESNKTYECEVCKRSFARSDMLTRHSRLHTGNSSS